ncbi:MAG: phosphoribosylformylglycinamidine synthase subunit PurS [Nanoarchaeota archaeon]
MSYIVELVILPKKDILDPQGNAVGDALRKIGYDTNRIRVGKYMKYNSNKENEEEVRAEVNDITKALISRGIIEFNTQTCQIHSLTKLEDKFAS